MPRLTVRQFSNHKWRRLHVQLIAQHGPPCGGFSEWKKKQGRRKICNYQMDCCHGNSPPVFHIHVPGDADCFVISVIVKLNVRPVPHLVRITCACTARYRLSDHTPTHYYYCWLDTVWVLPTSLVSIFTQRYLFQLIAHRFPPMSLPPPSWINGGIPRGEHFICSIGRVHSSSCVLGGWGIHEWGRETSAIEKRC